MYNALSNRSIGRGGNHGVEDAFAQTIISKVNNRTARTADERQWMRSKLQAIRIPGSTEYIPTPLRNMTALQRLTLERNV
jgi:hypothetical protein